MHKTFLLIAAALTAVTALRAQPVTPEHEARARELVGRMTLEEKIDYIGGYNTFFIRSVPRLGIPEIRMADGPQGVRNDFSAQLVGRDKKSTLYPCGMAAAATWDRELVRKMGSGIGQDARARGVHILLGPGVNIYRSPLCGRNFEYFGEDPYLVSETTVSMVEGIQSQGVMACAKHFAANNQEWDRYNVSSDVDERTLHEIYLPSFENAVGRAGIGALMCGYHLVNSVHSSEYGYLNVDVLRDRWGFKGILMSDWGGTYSTLGPVFNGLDIEMPGGGMMNRAKIMPLVENGVVDESLIDTKVQHILQSLLAFGFFDRPQKDERISERNPYSDSVALEVARAGVVLLKNDGLLPLAKGKVVVCGPNANTIVTGGGSGVVYPFESCSVAEGMRKMGRKYRSLYDTSGWKTDLSAFYADEACTVPGARVEYFNSKDLSGGAVHTAVVMRIDTEYPASPVPGIVDDDYSDRYTFYYKPAADSYLYLSAGGDDGYRLLIDGEPVIDDWENKAYRSKDIFRRFEAGRVYKFTYEHTDDYSVSRVMFRYSDHMNDPAFNEALTGADAVIACVGFDAVTGRRSYLRPARRTGRPHRCAASPQPQCYRRAERRRRRGYDSLVGPRACGSHGVVSRSAGRTGRRRDYHRQGVAGWQASFHDRKTTRRQSRLRKLPYQCGYEYVQYPLQAGSLQRGYLCRLPGIRTQWCRTALSVRLRTVVYDVRILRAGGRGDGRRRVCRFV